jgi:DNA-binding transcriptional MerR regulator
MRISELSAKTRVSVHRLRRYEADGLIESQRRPNGYRDYAETTVKHVIFIAMSREMGFSLPFIAEYLPRFKAGKLSAQDWRVWPRSTSSSTSNKRFAKN